MPKPPIEVALRMGAEVTEVTTIHLRPGDVLVVRMAADATLGDMRRERLRLEKVFRSVPVVVISGSTVLETLERPA